MKKPVFLALSILTGAALALPAAAQAQSQKPAAGASAAKKPVRKTKKGVPLKTAKAVEAQTPAQTLTARLTDDELQTAEQIHTGTFPCELGANVSVTADAANPGFFNVTSGKRRYYMHPVESRTGAIRMEDNRRGAVWLQLANKSELLDQKLGQRVADNCEATAQKDYAAQMQDRPHSQLLNSPANRQQTHIPADQAPASNENPSAAPVVDESSAGRAADAP